jgi:hypothetical protein
MEFVITDDGIVLAAIILAIGYVIGSLFQSRGSIWTLEVRNLVKRLDKFIEVNTKRKGE